MYFLKPQVLAICLLVAVCYVEGHPTPDEAGKTMTVALEEPLDGAMNAQVDQGMASHVEPPANNQNVEDRKAKCIFCP
ncbi:unnamed protein product [Pieris macdunnoughi]|uniref:Secreted protein n=1 Tax=Pieris macdunnoughi TaxID=345717 RepID=A0A821U9K2_9NEOP|nr:unnamed protein product [Pieris macdunnoughi]